MTITFQRLRIAMSYSDATLYIDLRAIEQNYRQLAGKSTVAECGAVVKANAYGLGVEPVSRKLAAAGCKSFFVATLDEALELRTILPDKNIFVFNGIRRGQESYFLENDIIPILNCREDMDIWNRFAARQHKKLPAIIHIDTGMNRLGFSPSLAFDIREKILEENIIPRYVMSHLACASLSDHPKNKEQLTRFLAVKKFFPKIPATFANSSGILLGQNYHFDLLRPGIALYDENVVRLIARIIQIREVDADGTVGYNATYKVKSGDKLAVVPVGYADGYLRSGFGKAHVYIGETKVPVVGRISMDTIILNVTEIPAESLQIGQEVEIMGKHCSVNDLAQMAGTISYEILTSLGSRYKRIISNSA